MNRRWVTLSASVPGSSHRRTGTPCQDFCGHRRVRVGKDTVLVAVVADGAGSARLGRIGAHIAVRSTLRHLAETVKQRGNAAAVQRQDMVAALTAVRRAVARKAGHRPISDYACTLSVAIIGCTGAAFGQVGDSVIVTRNENTFQTVFWPDNGEFINTTVFLTSDPLEENLRFASHAVAPLDVALFTDGLNSVALNLSARSAHGPFFAPLFNSLRLQLRHRVPHRRLRRQLHQFLGCNEVDSRSDDDRTLILISSLRGTCDGY